MLKSTVGSFPAFEWEICSGKPLTHVHIFILHLLSSVKIVAHNENVMTNNYVGLCLLAKMFCNYS